MRYLPPFEALKSSLEFSTVSGEMMVGGRYKDLLQMLRRLIADVPVDEVWYLERYPDIAEAISQGIVRSAKAHFVNDGYFEGLVPFPISWMNGTISSRIRALPSTCAKAT